MRRFGLFCKSIAAILCATFLISELAYAAPMENLFSNPGTPASIDQLHPPLDFCSVQSAYHGDASKPRIVYIQDAHSNISGQESIVGLLDEMTQGQKSFSVFSEGGEGDCSLTALKDLATKEVWQKTARKYFLDARIQAEEYLSLISDKQINIYGIEDNELYLQSVQLYANLSKNREDNLTYLSKIQASLAKLKNKFYPKELLEYEGLATRKSPSFPQSFGGNPLDARQKNSGMTDRDVLSDLLVLSDSTKQDISAYPNIQKIKTLKLQESQIDFTQANLEQAKLIESLGQEHLDELLKTYNKSKNSKASLLSYFQNIFNKAKQKNIQLNQYPNVLAYVNYLKQFEQVDIDTLLQEQQSLEDQMYVSILKTNPTQDALLVRSIDRYLKLLQTAYKIQMTSGEFKTFLANEKDFLTYSYLAFINRKLLEQSYYEDVISYKNTLDQGQIDLKNFYESIDQRDLAFIKNIQEELSKTKDKTAFLITGGYHTEHLTQLLKDKGYSYIVLSPHVTQETNQKRYEQRLLEPLKTAINKAPSFPQAFGGNPEETSNDLSSDARQKKSGMTSTSSATAKHDGVRAMLAMAELKYQGMSEQQKIVQEAILQLNKKGISNKRILTVIEILADLLSQEGEDIETLRSKMNDFLTTLPMEKPIAQPVINVAKEIKNPSLAVPAPNIKTLAGGRMAQASLPATETVSRQRIQEAAKRIHDKRMEGMTPLIYSFAGGGGKGTILGYVVEMLSKGTRGDIHFWPEKLYGTSVGSIISALMAAGYSAQDLMGFSEDPQLIKILKKKRHSWLPAFIAAFVYGGMYPGDEFKAWFNEKLKAKFIEEGISKNEISDITFKDLPFPLTVVATGISGSQGQKVVFNKDATPDVSVADAVRASLSLPAFFEPHRMNIKNQKTGLTESVLFIDGGLLQNDPAALAAEDNRSRTPIVAFGYGDPGEWLTNQMKDRSWKGKILTLVSSVPLRPVFLLGVVLAVPFGLLSAPVAALLLAVSAWLLYSPIWQVLGTTFFAHMGASDLADKKDNKQVIYVPLPVKNILRTTIFDYPKAKLKELSEYAELFLRTKLLVRPGAKTLAGSGASNELVRRDGIPSNFATVKDLLHRVNADGQAVDLKPRAVVLSAKTFDDMLTLATHIREMEERGEGIAEVSAADAPGAFVAILIAAGFSGADIEKILTDKYKRVVKTTRVDRYTEQIIEDIKTIEFKGIVKSLKAKKWGWVPPWLYFLFTGAKYDKRPLEKKILELLSDKLIEEKLFNDSRPSIEDFQLGHLPIRLILPVLDVRSGEVLVLDSQDLSTQYAYTLSDAFEMATASPGYFTPEKHDYRAGHVFVSADYTDQHERLLRRRASRSYFQSDDNKLLSISAHAQERPSLIGGFLARYADKVQLFYVLIRTFRTVLRRSSRQVEDVSGVEIVDLPSPVVVSNKSGLRALLGEATSLVVGGRLTTTQPELIPFSDTPFANGGVDALLKELSPSGREARVETISAEIPSAAWTYAFLSNPDPAVVELERQLRESKASLVYLVLRVPGMVFSDGQVATKYIFVLDEPSVIARNLDLLSREKTNSGKPFLNKFHFHLSLFEASGLNSVHYHFKLMSVGNGTDRTIPKRQGYGEGVLRAFKNNAEEKVRNSGKSEYFVSTIDGSHPTPGERGPTAILLERVFNAFKVSKGSTNYSRATQFETVNDSDSESVYFGKVTLEAQIDLGEGSKILYKDTKTPLYQNDAYHIILYQKGEQYFLGFWKNAEVWATVLLGASDEESAGLAYGAVILDFSSIFKAVNREGIDPKVRSELAVGSIAKIATIERMTNRGFLNLVPAAQSEVSPAGSRAATILETLLPLPNRYTMEMIKGDDKQGLEEVSKAARVLWREVPPGDPADPVFEHILETLKTDEVFSVFVVKDPSGKTIAIRSFYRAQSGRLNNFIELRNQPGIPYPTLTDMGKRLLRGDIVVGIGQRKLGIASALYAESLRYAATVPGIDYALVGINEKNIYSARSMFRGAEANKMDIHGPLSGETENSFSYLIDLRPNQNKSQGDASILEKLSLLPNSFVAGSRSATQTAPTQKERIAPWERTYKIVFHALLLLAFSVPAFLSYVFNISAVYLGVGPSIETMGFTNGGSSLVFTRYSIDWLNWSFYEIGKFAIYIDSYREYIDSVQQGLWPEGQLWVAPIWTNPLFVPAIIMVLYGVTLGVILNSGALKKLFFDLLTDVHESYTFAQFKQKLFNTLYEFKMRLKYATTDKQSAVIALDDIAKHPNLRSVSEEFLKKIKVQDEFSPGNALVDKYSRSALFNEPRAVRVLKDPYHPNSVILQFDPTFETVSELTRLLDKIKQYKSITSIVVTGNPVSGLNLFVTATAWLPASNGLKLPEQDLFRSDVSEVNLYELPVGSIVSFQSKAYGNRYFLRKDSEDEVTLSTGADEFFALKGRLHWVADDLSEQGILREGVGFSLPLFTSYAADAISPKPTNDFLNAEGWSDSVANLFVYYPIPIPLESGTRLSQSVARKTIDTDIEEAIRNTDHPEYFDRVINTAMSSELDHVVFVAELNRLAARSSAADGDALWKNFINQAENFLEKIKQSKELYVYYSSFFRPYIRSDSKKKGSELFRALTVNSTLPSSKVIFDYNASMDQKAEAGLKGDPWDLSEDGLRSAIDRALVSDSDDSVVVQNIRDISGNMNLKHDDIEHVRVMHIQEGRFQRVFSVLTYLHDGTIIPFILMIARAPDIKPEDAGELRTEYIKSTVVAKEFELLNQFKGREGIVQLLRPGRVTLDDQRELAFYTSHYLNNHTEVVYDIPERRYEPQERSQPSKQIHAAHQNSSLPWRNLVFGDGHYSEIARELIAGVVSKYIIFSDPEKGSMIKDFTMNAGDVGLDETLQRVGPYNELQFTMIAYRGAKPTDVVHFVADLFSLKWIGSKMREFYVESLDESPDSYGTYELFKDENFPEWLKSGILLGLRRGLREKYGIEAGAKKFNEWIQAYLDAVDKNPNLQTKVTRELRQSVQRADGSAQYYSDPAPIFSREILKSELKKTEAEALAIQRIDDLLVNDDTSEFTSQNMIFERTPLPALKTIFETLQEKVMAQGSKEGLRGKKFVGVGSGDDARDAWYAAAYGMDSTVFELSDELSKKAEAFKAIARGALGVLADKIDIIPGDAFKQEQKTSEADVVYFFYTQPSLDHASSEEIDDFRKDFLGMLSRLKPGALVALVFVAEKAGSPNSLRDEIRDKLPLLKMLEDKDLTDLTPEYGDGFNLVIYEVQKPSGVRLVGSGLSLDNLPLLTRPELDPYPILAEKVYFMEDHALPVGSDVTADGKIVYSLDDQMPGYRLLQHNRDPYSADDIMNAFMKLPAISTFTGMTRSYPEFAGAGLAKKYFIRKVKEKYYILELQAYWKGSKEEAPAYSDSLMISVSNPVKLQEMPVGMLANIYNENNVLTWQIRKEANGLVQVWNAQKPGTGYVGPPELISTIVKLIPQASVVSIEGSLAIDGILKATDRIYVPQSITVQLSNPALAFKYKFSNLFVNKPIEQLADLSTAPLGSGTYSVVYTALDIQEGLDGVVYKVGSEKYKGSQESLIDAFAREILVTQKLRALGVVNIPEVLAVGVTASGKPWIKYRSPVSVALNDVKLSTIENEAERLGLWISVLEAVKSLHDVGFVHGDLKPQNILMSIKDLVPTIIDLAGADRKGWLARLATEAFSDQQPFLDYSSDVYSLGVTISEMYKQSGLELPEWQKNKKEKGSIQELVERMTDRKKPEEMIRRTRLGRMMDVARSWLAKKWQATAPKSPITTLEAALDELRLMRIAAVEREDLAGSRMVDAKPIWQQIWTNEIEPTLRSEGLAAEQIAARRKIVDEHVSAASSQSGGILGRGFGFDEKRDLDKLIKRLLESNVATGRNEFVFTQLGLGRIPAETSAILQSYLKQAQDLGMTLEGTHVRFLGLDVNDQAIENHSPLNTDAWFTGREVTDSPVKYPSFTGRVRQVNGIVREELDAQDPWLGEGHDKKFSESDIIFARNVSTGYFNNSFADIAKFFILKNLLEKYSKPGSYLVLEARNDYSDAFSMPGLALAEGFSYASGIYKVTRDFKAQPLRFQEYFDFGESSGSRFSTVNPSWKSAHARQFISRFDLMTLQPDELSAKWLALAGSDILHWFKNNSVLNIGLETSGTPEVLAEHNLVSDFREHGISNIVGVSPKVIDSAENAAKGYFNGGVGGTYKLLFEDDHFDKVIVEALFDPVYFRESEYLAALAEIFRVLKPGGLLYVSFATVEKDTKAFDAALAENFIIRAQIHDPGGNGVGYILESNKDRERRKFSLKNNAHFYDKLLPLVRSNSSDIRISGMKRNLFRQYGGILLDVLKEELNTPAPGRPIEERPQDTVSRLYEIAQEIADKGFRPTFKRQSSSDLDAVDIIYPYLVKSMQRAANDPEIRRLNIKSVRDAQALFRLVTGRTDLPHLLTDAEAMRLVNAASPAGVRLAKSYFSPDKISIAQPLKLFGAYAGTRWVSPANDVLRLSAPLFAESLGLLQADLSRYERERGRIFNFDNFFLLELFTKAVTFTGIAAGIVAIQAPLKTWIVLLGLGSYWVFRFFSGMRWHVLSRQLGNLKNTLTFEGALRNGSYSTRAQAAINKVWLLMFHSDEHVSAMAYQIIKKITEVMPENQLTRKFKEVEGSLVSIGYLKPELAFEDLTTGRSSIPSVFTKSWSNGDGVRLADGSRSWLEIPKAHHWADRWKRLVGRKTEAEVFRSISLKHGNPYVNALRDQVAEKGYLAGMTANIMIPNTKEEFDEISRLRGLSRFNSIGTGIKTHAPAFVAIQEAFQYVHPSSLYHVGGEPFNAVDQILDSAGPNYAKVESLSKPGTNYREQGVAIIYDKQRLSFIEDSKISRDMEPGHFLIARFKDIQTGEELAIASIYLNPSHKEPDASLQKDSIYQSKESGRRSRAEQISEILKALEKFNDIPVIITGDFNPRNQDEFRDGKRTGDQPSMKTLLGQFSFREADGGLDIMTMHPKNPFANKFTKQADPKTTLGVFSQGIEAIYSGVFNEPGEAVSDHYPRLTYFEPKKIPSKEGARLVSVDKSFNDFGDHKNVMTLERAYQSLGVEKKWWHRFFSKFKVAGTEVIQVQPRWFTSENDMTILRTSDGWTRFYDGSGRLSRAEFSGKVNTYDTKKVDVFYYEGSSLTPYQRHQASSKTQRMGLDTNALVDRLKNYRKNLRSYTRFLRKNKVDAAQVLETVRIILNNGQFNTAHMILKNLPDIYASYLESKADEDRFYPELSRKKFDGEFQDYLKYIAKNGLWRGTSTDQLKEALRDRKGILATPNFTFYPNAVNEHLGRLHPVSPNGSYILVNFDLEKLPLNIEVMSGGSEIITRNSGDINLNALSESSKVKVTRLLGVTRHIYGGVLGNDWPAYFEDAYTHFTDQVQSVLTRAIKPDLSEKDADFAETQKAIEIKKLFKAYKKELWENATVDSVSVVSQFQSRATDYLIQNACQMVDARYPGQLNQGSLLKTGSYASEKSSLHSDVDLIWLSSQEVAENPAVAKARTNLYHWLTDIFDGNFSFISYTDIELQKALQLTNFSPAAASDYDDESLALFTRVLSFAFVHGDVKPYRRAEADFIAVRTKEFAQKVIRSLILQRDHQFQQTAREAEIFKDSLGGTREFDHAQWLIAYASRSGLPIEYDAEAFERAQEAYWRQTLMRSKHKDDLLALSDAEYIQYANDALELFDFSVDMMVSVWTRVRESSDPVSLPLFLVSHIEPIKTSVGAHSYAESSDGKLSLNLWPSNISGVYQLFVRFQEDRPGLLADVLGVFALNGLNVLKANIHTDTGGVSDMFWLEGFEQEGDKQEIALRKILDQIQFLLNKDYDASNIETLFAQAGKQYSFSRDELGRKLRSHVLIQREKEKQTLTFLTRDIQGPGLLHLVSRWLASHDINIVESGKIRTQGGMAFDSYVIALKDGSPIEEEKAREAENGLKAFLDLQVIDANSFGSVNGARFADQAYLLIQESDLIKYARADLQNIYTQAIEDINSAELMDLINKGDPGNEARWRNRMASDLAQVSPDADLKILADEIYKSIRIVLRSSSDLGWPQLCIDASGAALIGLRGINEKRSPEKRFSVKSYKYTFPDGHVHWFLRIKQGDNGIIFDPTFEQFKKTPADTSDVRLAAGSSFAENAGLYLFQSGHVNALNNLLVMAGRGRLTARDLFGDHRVLNLGVESDENFVRQSRIQDFNLTDFIAGYANPKSVVGVTPLADDKNPLYVHGYAQKLPQQFADESVDDVVSINLFDPDYLQPEQRLDRPGQSGAKVMNLIQFYEASIAEVSRVLRVGGKFYVHFTTRDEMTNYYRDQFFMLCYKYGMFPNAEIPETQGNVAFIFSKVSKEDHAHGVRLAETFAIDFTDNDGKSHLRTFTPSSFNIFDQAEVPYIQILNNGKSYQLPFTQIRTINIPNEFFEQSANVSEDTKRFIAKIVEFGLRNEKDTFVSYGSESIVVNFPKQIGDLAVALKDRLEIPGVVVKIPVAEESEANPMFPRTLSVEETARLMEKLLKVSVEHVVPTVYVKVELDKAIEIFSDKPRHSPSGSVSVAIQRECELLKASNLPISTTVLADRYVAMVRNMWANGFIDVDAMRYVENTTLNGGVLRLLDIGFVYEVPGDSDADKIQFLRQSASEKLFSPLEFFMMKVFYSSYRTLSIDSPIREVNNKVIEQLFDGIPHQDIINFRAIFENAAAGLTDDMDGKRIFVQRSKDGIVKNRELFERIVSKLRLSEVEGARLIEAGSSFADIHGVRLTNEQSKQGISQRLGQESRGLLKTALQHGALKQRLPLLVKQIREGKNEFVNASVQAVGSNTVVFYLDNQITETLVFSQADLVAKVDMDVAGVQSIRESIQSSTEIELAAIATRDLRLGDRTLKDAFIVNDANSKALPMVLSQQVLIRRVLTKKENEVIADKDLAEVTRRAVESRFSEGQVVYETVIVDEITGVETFGEDQIADPSKYKVMYVGNIPEPLLRIIAQHNESLAPDKAYGVVITEARVSADAKNAQVLPDTAAFFTAIMAACPSTFDKQKTADYINRYNGGIETAGIEDVEHLNAVPVGAKDQGRSFFKKSIFRAITAIPMGEYLVAASRMAQAILSAA